MKSLKENIKIRIRHANHTKPENIYTLKEVIEEWYFIVGYPNSLYYDLKDGEYVEYTLESMTDDRGKEFCDEDLLRVDKALTITEWPAVENYTLILPDIRRLEVTYENLEQFLDYPEVWNSLFKHFSVRKCFDDKTINNYEILYEYLDNAGYIGLKSFGRYSNDIRIATKSMDIDPFSYNFYIGEEIKSNFDVMLHAVKSGLPVEYLHHSALSMLDIALEAIKINRESIFFFEESIRRNKDVIKTGIRYDKTGTFVLNTDFSDDRGMIEFSVKHHGMVTLYLSDYSSDIDLIHLALIVDKNNGVDNTSFIDSSLLYCNDFINEFIEDFPEIYASLPETMKTFEVTRKVLSRNGSMYIHIPEELRDSYELKTLARTSPDCDVYVPSTYLNFKIKRKWYDIMNDYIL